MFVQFCEYHGSQVLWRRFLTRHVDNNPCGFNYYDHPNASDFQPLYIPSSREPEKWDFATWY